MARLLLRCLLVAAAFSLPVENVAGSLEAPHVAAGVTMARGGQSSATGNAAPEAELRAEAEGDNEEPSQLFRVEPMLPALEWAWAGGHRELGSRSVEARPVRSAYVFGPSSARAPPSAA